MLDSTADVAQLRKLGARKGAEVNIMKWLEIEHVSYTDCKASLLIYKVSIELDQSFQVQRSYQSRCPYLAGTFSATVRYISLSSYNC